MRKLLPLLLVLGLLAGVAAPAVVYAATDTPTPAPTIPTIKPPPSCGDIWNPCGALPFQPPVLVIPSFIPTLPSPTFIAITATPTITNTPTGTLTPTFTPTPCPTFTPIPTPTGTPPTPDGSFSDPYLGTVPCAGSGVNVQDTGRVVQQVETYSAQLMKQSTVTINISGNTYGINEVSQQLGSASGGFFGFFKGLTDSTSQLGLIGAVINFILFAIAFSFFVRLFVAVIPLISYMIGLLLPILQAFFQALSALKPW